MLMTRLDIQVAQEHLLASCARADLLDQQIRRGLPVQPPSDNHHYQTPVELHLRARRCHQQVQRIWHQPVLVEVCLSLLGWRHTSSDISDKRP